MSRDVIEREVARHVAPGQADGRAVIATDTEGYIVHWNSGAERLYGWSADEVLGRNVLDVTPATMSSAEAEEIMHRVNAGETWSGSFLVRHRGGQPMKVHVSDIPVMHEGRVVGVIGISAAAD